MPERSIANALTIASSRRSRVAAHLPGEERVVCLLREQRTPGRYLQPVLLPSAPEPASGVSGSCCSLVTGLSLYHTRRGAYTHSHSSRLEGLYSSLLFVCCLCLLIAHTYQAILVLLPKLTNAPTKVHTGCLAHWGSRMLYTFVMYNASFYCWLFFCIAMIIFNPHSYIGCTYHF